MRKELALYATVAALAVAPAFAQSNMQQDRQQPAPQAQPSQPSTSAPSSASPSTTTQAPKAMTGEKFVDMQASGQWLSSDLIGMNVIGSKNETIGSVSDLLVDGEGNIVAAIIGVGGFLGIGQKNVAVSFDTLNVAADKDGDPEARLTLTKEELENAPAFKTLADTKSASQRPSTPASKPATPRN
jgi:sporulation protein YlmC with PRC-barrel domain